MIVFQIVGAFVFVGCWWAWSSSNAINSRFDDWIPYPDAARWVLYIAGVVILLAGLGMNSGGDCYTDWDGISNPVVCD